MLGLLATTIITSAADSLNPVAITQQFVLQGMVKRPSHIWFFILATGITNFIGGLMVYFGLSVFIASAVDFIMDQFGAGIFIFELIVGIVFLGIALYLICRRRLKPNVKPVDIKKESAVELEEKAQLSLKIKSVTPPALFVLGVIATIAELTTALPYFAFLGVLLNYELNVMTAVLVLLLYNFIYASPLMVLYFVYRKKQTLFESFYLLVKGLMKRWSAILLPFVFIAIGGFFTFYATTALMG